MLFAFPLLALTLLAGCEDTVNPILGEDRPFTIWGYLDAGADTQYVRVFTVEDRLGLDRPGDIDARVFSTDLTTGEKVEWQHEVLAFENGQFGHAFAGAFVPVKEQRYRLEVVRSDGATTSAEVTIPLPVNVEPGSIDAQQRIELFIPDTAPNLVRVEMFYDVFTVPPSNPWPPGSPTPTLYKFPVTIPYGDELLPALGGWRVRVELRRDFGRIQRAYQLNCLTDELIGFRRASFRFLAADETWSPPGGVFDPNILVEPGAFSNVTNGFGFFGAGFTVETEIKPSQDELRRIGYTFEAPCPMTPQNLPECQLPPEPCFR